jgi:HD-GYP domain-containing protein (c-di-GMP phosphodiesterase class II)
MTEAPESNANPRLQRLGRALVLQMQMVLRTMRLHDTKNQTLLVATENLKDTINTLWAALDGTVRLQFVDGIVFLNDTRLRFGPSMKMQLDNLEKEFSDRKMGGISFSRPVDTVILRDFLLAFSGSSNTDEGLQQIRSALEQMKDLALDLLGPRTFTDEDEVQEQLRIDRKTFALQTYAKAIIFARAFIDALRKGEDPFANRLQVSHVVQDLIDIATERVNLLLKMASIKTAHDYVYNHAANTCVLSIVIGKALGIGRIELVDLGLAALLADVGFALLPPEVLDSQREISPEEKDQIMDIMVGHLRHSIGSRNLSTTSIRRFLVSYEHHRSYRLASGEVAGLHPFSRIVAVADAFDALTTQRPWREGYPPDEALQILLRDADKKYDPVVVRVLVNLLGVYPLGSIVRLNSGEVGLVYHNSNDPRLFEKPWVKVLVDAAGQTVRRTLLRNLAENGSSYRIVGNASGEILKGRDLGFDLVA